MRENKMGKQVNTYEQEKKEYSRPPALSIPRPTCN
jgi:hypothetical protein